MYDHVIKYLVKNGKISFNFSFLNFKFILYSLIKNKIYLIFFVCNF